MSAHRRMIHMLNDQWLQTRPSRPPYPLSGFGSYAGGRHTTSAAKTRREAGCAAADRNFGREGGGGTGRAIPAAVKRAV